MATRILPPFLALLETPPAKTSTPACDSPDGIPAPQSLYSIVNSLRSVLSTVNILNAVSSSRHTSRVTLDRLADSFSGTGTSLRSCTDCFFGIALVEHQVYPRCRLAFLSHLSCSQRRLRADSAQLRQCLITCPVSLRPLPRDRNFRSWQRTPFRHGFFFVKRGGRPLSGGQENW